MEVFLVVDVVGHSSVLPAKNVPVPTERIAMSAVQLFLDLPAVLSAKNVPVPTERIAIPDVQLFLDLSTAVITVA